MTRAHTTFADLPQGHSFQFVDPATGFSARHVKISKTQYVTVGGGGDAQTLLANHSTTGTAARVIDNGRVIF